MELAELGITLHSVTQRLEDTPTRRLADQTFRDLMRNELFVGVMVDRKRGLRVQGYFEPLISRELFEAVQLILEGRRPSVTAKLRENPEFPLRGFVRCKTCRTSLTASFSTSKSGAKHWAKQALAVPEAGGGNPQGSPYKLISQRL